jgi:hypothetical protein
MSSLRRYTSPRLLIPRSFTRPPVPNVRVLDPTGKVLRAFEVTASYAFGGAAGRQDSIRLDYLYEKFAELTRDQLRDQK